MNQDHPYREDKIRVEVGDWAPDGTFLGSIIEFYGQEAGSWTELTGRMSDRLDRGTIRTLYRVIHPDSGEGYRVYEKEWSRWQGEGDWAILHPVEEESYGGVFFRHNPKRPRREPYLEDEARARFPRLFAALGLPNVIQLDDEEGGGQ